MDSNYKKYLKYKKKYLEFKKIIKGSGWKTYTVTSLNPFTIQNKDKEKHSKGASSKSSLLRLSLCLSLSVSFYLSFCLSSSAFFFLPIARLKISASPAVKPARV